VQCLHVSLRILSQFEELVGDFFYFIEFACVLFHNFDGGTPGACRGWLGPFYCCCQQRAGVREPYETSLTLNAPSSERFGCVGYRDLLDAILQDGEAANAELKAVLSSANGIG
jgi:hypothetical protein